jgi:periplasmic divalent cation tolerance protein
MIPILVLVTVPDAETGKTIARALVEKELAACGNLIPGLTSIYRWQGKVEEASEHLLILKSAREHWDALQAEIKKLHPYDCPEIVEVSPGAISPDYAAWWRESVGLG